MIDGEIAVVDTGDQAVITLTGSNARGVQVANNSQVDLDISESSIVGSDVNIDTECGECFC